MLNFSEGRKTYLHFVSFLQVDMMHVVEILPQVNKNLPILHSQYNGCWYPGDARSQSINNHDIDYVEPN